MFCPLLCIKPDNIMVSVGQCMEEACAWWIIDNSTGKCAICQMGEYAAKQSLI
jgi:predicted RNA-binding Zn ribbon-like protein